MLGRSFETHFGAFVRGAGGGLAGSDEMQYEAAKVTEPFVADAEAHFDSSSAPMDAGVAEPWGEIPTQGV